MQARPPPPERFVPPTAPGVPVHAMQSLIPRLATTINDIDNLRNLIGSGNADGSMPNWDTLLQRYSMLLGRVQQLSAYIAQESRNVPGRPVPGAAGAAAAAAVRPPAPDEKEKSAGPPALSHYLVHALRALPPDCGPVAPEVLFQVINTMQLPQLAESQGELLKEPSPSFLSLPGQVSLQPLDQLQKLDDAGLARLTGNMNERLKREHQRAAAMVKEITRREEEYDWQFRINEDEDDDEKDDLFDEEDEEGDSKMKEEEPPKLPNPRDGWKVGDYLRFLDSGKRPEVPEGVIGAAAPGAAGPVVV